MTIVVTEADLEVHLFLNQSNLDGDLLYEWTITSQYSHQPELIPSALISSNDRWSMVQVLFPTGFGDNHKNGIYNWSYKVTGGSVIEEGLVKIICEPGGETGIVDYTSTPALEDREADVYYRPNY